MKTGKNTFIGLTVASLSRWLIYKPLAILMAILLAPGLSWSEGGGGKLARPLASAQIQVQGCASTTNSIIQNYCVNSSIYFNDLVQLESDAVSTYLAMHGLPTSDAQLVYQGGREDLRDAIRGVMSASLIAIIVKPASQRTAHEQSLYNWLQALVRQNEITEYTQALNHFHSFQTDPCHFTLDPDLAAQYKLSYDGTPFCFALQSSIFQPPIPAPDYFIAYGMKLSYEKPASTDPSFSAHVAGTTIGAYEALSGLAAAGNVVALSTPISLIQNLIAGFYLIQLLGFDGIPVALAASSSTFATIAAGSVYTGPAGALLLCLIAGVAAGLELYSNQAALNTLNNLQNSLVQVEQNAPDLGSFVLDKSGVGLLKLKMSLDAQTLPDVPSTAALPVHRPGTDLQFSVIPEGGGPAAHSDTPLAYQDWSGLNWSAQTYGGWFVQTCVSTTKATCARLDSLIASINYVDWSGTAWIGSRLGNVFVSAKAVPASTDAACPADSTSGVSPGTDFSNCSSYVSKSIPVTDAAGNHVSVSFAPHGFPSFTGPSSLAFGPSVPKTATIAVSGDPTPSVCVQSSNLPGNFTLNGGTCGNGSFQLIFDGAANAPQNNYSLTLTASNSLGTATQTFTINVSPQLAIISTNSMNVTAGIPASFTVVATGVPTPQLSIDGVPLGGLTFTDNGNGTATIDGIDTSTLTTLNCKNIVTGNPCGIVATSSQGTFRQPFTIFVNPAPTATLVGCSSNPCPSGTTFFAGAPNQVLLLSTGAITPVSWSFTELDAPPSWLNLHDNGNGTATLSGTPPLGTTGTFNVGIDPLAADSIGSIDLYPITVLNAPAFTSQNTVTFTAGSFGSFSIGANMGTLSLSGTPPPGLSFTSSGSTATISGNPPTGTGGQYQLTLTDNDGTNGTATQILTLTVYEAPQITSRNTATMFVGVPGMFSVTTTGFPNVSNHPIADSALPPTDPSQGEGMVFTVTGLPLGLQARNLNVSGFTGGTLTIEGTPAAPGTYPVQITAQNGVGQAAQQTLTLNIVQITGPAPTSGSTCNGNYNGTFNGTVTVSAGQNCSFYGGVVNGNVDVNGGHLALNNSTVSGNMSIQGGSGFSFGAGTNIGGNLSIQNVGSGSTASQMCQATVSGNLDIVGNAIPIQIGNPQNLCFGNSFGKNVDLSGNTGPLAFYENTARKVLSCSSNASITGGGNSAQKKEGQCATF